MAIDPRRPNIVYILADDMGYGDLGCNNPASRIPTPNLDRLCAQGMRFTDAHAGSSLCTPSRYNVLTGRYCWRSRLKRGIVWAWDSPLIEEGRLTVAEILRRQGYATHAVGKWHLGWDWTTVDGQSAGAQLPFGQFDPSARAAREAMGKRVDFSRRVGGGPVDRGFDTYFGVDVPNFPPYAWFENDRLTELPTAEKPDGMYGHPGPAVLGWSLEAMLPEFSRRVVSLIEQAVQPYFLYYALTAPHAPIVPNEPFRGKSRAGKYGDFVCEVDALVGEVMSALERTGQAENTLLIFTSDNGPEANRCDYEGCYELARTTGHYSMGSWRGTKRDLWEGGHREPFVARWPAVIPAGSVCDQLVSLGDLMATCAEITGAGQPAGAGEDSISMLPLLQGHTDRPTRSHLIHHGGKGELAVRKGACVLIDAPTGGDVAEPAWFVQERGYAGHGEPRELFHLDTDAAQRSNRYAEEPDTAADLLRVLAAAKREAAFGDNTDGPQEGFTA